MKKEEVVETLIKHCFADHINWTPPILEDVIGPHYPEVFDEFEFERDARLAKIRHNLLNHELVELENYLFCRVPSINKTKRRLDRLAIVQRTIADATLPTIPVWFAAGFGSVAMQADFKYWANIGNYSEGEALSLMLGFEPTQYDRDMFIEQSKKGARNKEIVNFLVNFSQRLSRKFNPYGMPSCNIGARDLYDWIVSVEVPVNKKFFAELSKVVEPEAKRGELDPREKTSLLQLIYLLARDGYGFEPSSKRTELPKLLFDAAELNGVKISRDTIRKHLYASAEPYSEPWKTE